MMSLALSFILLFIFAFPGHAARMAYLTGDFSRDALPRSLTSDISRAILYSIPFHIFGILTVNLFLSDWVEASFRFEPLLRLLSMPHGENDKELITISGNLEKYSLQFALYIGTLTAIGLGCGTLLREQVWKRRWDVHYPEIFGYNNEWLYAFTGRGQFPTQVSAVVDALVDVKNKTRLYRGVVFAFNTDDEGALRDITLLYTLRGKFKEVVENGPQQFCWENVPGDYFVIKYSEVINLNITYADLSHSESPALEVRALHQRASASSDEPPLRQLPPYL